MNKHEPDDNHVTRREFVGSVVAGGIGAGISAESAAAADSAAIPTVHCTLNINGYNRKLSLDPRTTLLDALRENLGLTGTKKGCDHGQCGACTVLVNERRINSCLSLALRHEGDQITTIEGLATGHELHPVQAAFLEHDGFQCGYCTPGQICSAVAMLDEVKAGMPSYSTADIRSTAVVQLSDDEIRERMSGNICRCGAYPNIVTAVRAVGMARRAS
jgi:xanthine dehydrogenase YagT iron-sulfur-binding subunit